MKYDIVFKTAIDHDRGFQKYGIFIKTAIMIAILRNRVPTICIFETVRFFRSDYSGPFASRY